MNKKIIALIAALVMIVQTVVPVFAVALSAREKAQTPEPTEARDVQTRGTYENLTYAISDGEVTITGYETEPLGELLIPETIDGYPVTTIGVGAFAACSAVTSVDMPSVKTIERNAFGSIYYNTMSIKSINMINVCEIRELAFEYCDLLTEVTIPNVQKIGDYAFYNCSALKCVDISNIQSIGLGAFSRCWELSSVIISESNKTYSSDGAIIFNRDNTALIAYPSAKADIVLPDSVVSVEEGAFMDCAYLLSISMPNVKSIGDFAFEFSGLISIDLSEVSYIGEGAFFGSDNLNQFIVSDSNEFFSAEGGVLFNKDKTKLICYPSARNNYVVPETVIEISSYEFQKTGIKRR